MPSSIGVSQASSVVTSREPARRIIGGAANALTHAADALDQRFAGVEIRLDDRLRGRCGDISPLDGEANQGPLNEGILPSADLVTQPQTSRGRRLLRSIITSTGVFVPAFRAALSSAELNVRVASSIVVSRRVVICRQGRPNRHFPSPEPGGLVERLSRNAMILERNASSLATRSKPAAANNPTVGLCMPGVEGFVERLGKSGEQAVPPAGRRIAASRPAPGGRPAATPARTREPRAGECRSGSRAADRRMR